MKILIELINFSYLSFLSFFSSQKHPRTPEPCLVTTDVDAVKDYERAVDSSLTLLYGINLQTLKLLLNNHDDPIEALDLGCGPGIFTSWMASNFNLSTVYGLDLSQPMLENSRKRFEGLNNPCEYEFIQQDISDLRMFADKRFKLITFMDAAHHLLNLEDLNKTLIEAERVCSSDGIIFLSDLVRPKNKRIFNFYYKWISKKNEKLKMKAHNVDFFNSLHAAWTCEEIARCIPPESSRTWVQIYPVGFKYMQILIALPKDFPELSLSKLDTKSVIPYIPEHLRSTWKAVILSYKYASVIKRVH